MTWLIWKGAKVRNIVYKKSFVSGVSFAVVVFVSMVYSHCQIPCGIYDDRARFDAIAENAATIEKSMKQMTDLSNVEKLITLLAEFRTAYFEDSGHKH